MKDLSFGLSLTVVGMFATFLTLFLITLLIRLLTHFFPYGEEKESEKK